MPFQNQVPLRPGMAFSGRSGSSEFANRSRSTNQVLPGQRNKFCPAPPTPGAGKTAIDKNIAVARAQAAENRSNPASIDYLANLRDESLEVTDAKAQNYKKNPKYPGCAAYGNFNFGATMQARGFSLQGALRYFKCLPTSYDGPRRSA
jgi:hypothetical protein